MWVKYEETRAIAWNANNTKLKSRKLKENMYIIYEVRNHPVHRHYIMGKHWKQTATRVFSGFPHVLR